MTELQGLLEAFQELFPLAATTSRHIRGSKSRSLTLRQALRQEHGDVMPMLGLMK